MLVSHYNPYFLWPFFKKKVKILTFNGNVKNGWKTIWSKKIIKSLGAYGEIKDLVFNKNPHSSHWSCLSTWFWTRHSPLVLDPLRPTTWAPDLCLLTKNGQKEGPFQFNKDGCKIFLVLNLIKSQMGKLNHRQWTLGQHETSGRHKVGKMFVGPSHNF